MKKFAAQLTRTEKRPASTAVVHAKSKNEAVRKIKEHAPEISAADVYRFN